MTTRTVLMVGGTVRAARMAVAAGVRVALVQTPDVFDDAFTELVIDHELADHTDPDTVLAAARRLCARTPVRRALSLTEGGLVPAAVVNEALGFGGNPAAVSRLLKDKWAMRRHLASRGFDDVRARLVSSPAELRNAMLDFGGPVIVKPRDGAGSERVVRLDDPLAVHRFWAGHVAAGGGEPLVEEYLDGPEVSVETFTRSGHHDVIAVTEKTTLPNLVEIGHTVPAALPPGLDERLRRTVTDFLDAVGLRDGPAHTEVKLCADRPRVVESHDRVGGGKIFDLVRLTSGVDLIGRSFRHAAGLDPSPPDAPTAKAASIRFLTAEPGTVTRVEGVQDVLAHPAAGTVHLDVEPGTRVRPLAGSDDRCGYVIAVGDTPDQARATATALASRIAITTVE